MPSKYYPLVGSYFVKKYYHALRTERDKVYQFYTEKSTMLRIDRRKHETASAKRDIQSLIQSLNFSEVKIETTDSLDSFNEGVLVMVSGSVQPKDYYRRRNFIQTFFLAPLDNGYYVLSDIFHFLDEENIHKQQAAILADNHIDSKVNASNPLAEPEKLSEETAVEDLSTAVVHAKSFVQDPSPVLIEDPFAAPKKPSYACILGVAKAQSTASVAPQLSVKKSAGVARAQSTASVASQRPVKKSVPPVEEGEGTSVYLGGLTTAISSSVIEKELKKFGDIMPGGVVIKNRQDTKALYAFVKFKDPVGAQTAINASPVMVSEKNIWIEKPRNSSTSIGRGRGGNSTDASKGRTGTLNFGRGSADGADRDYNRSRGNVNYPRGATR